MSNPKQKKAPPEAAKQFEPEVTPEPDPLPEVQAEPKEQPKPKIVRLIALKEIVHLRFSDVDGAEYYLEELPGLPGRFQLRQQFHTLVKGV